MERSVRFVDSLDSRRIRLSRAALRSVRAWASAFVVVLAMGQGAHAAVPTDLRVRAVATSFTAGATGMYSVSVTNLGMAGTDVPVHVTTTLPTGLTFVSGGGAGVSCQATGQALDCSLGTIPSASSSALRVVVRVGSAAVPGVSVSFVLSYPGDTNAANNTTTRSVIVKPRRGPEPSPTRTGTGTPATAATPPTPAHTPTRTITRTATQTPIGSPTPNPIATDLMLTVISAGTFTVGGTAAYFLTVTNLGGNDTNVPMTILDVLPTGISFVSRSGDGWTCAAAEVVNCINPNPLPAGTTSSLTLTVSVGEAAYPSVTNVVSLGYAADTDPANNTARRPTTVRRPRPVVPSAATPTTGTTVPGEAPTRTATPTPQLGPTITPSNATATDLSLSKTTSGAFRVGSTGQYTLSVRNLGSASTNAPVTIVDTLPPALSLAAVDTGGGFSCTAAGTAVTCTRAAPITAGNAAAVVLTVNVGSDAFPTVTNAAALFYAGDTDTTNNDAKRPTTVKR